MGKIGINFLLEYCVSEVIENGEKILVKAKNQQNECKKLFVDYLLFMVGHNLLIQNLSLKKIGVSTNKKVNILVDKNLQTSVKKYLCYWCFYWGNDDSP